MKKPKLYLDTSVISFYFAEDTPEKMAVTRKFFEEALKNGQYEIFSSEITLRELGNCTDPVLQDQLVGFAAELPVTYLPVTSQVGDLALEFVSEGLIPEKYQEDALHLAFALIHDIDYVVSWNFKHIVKPKTKKAVKIIALKEGFKQIEIITPEEVAANAGEI
ncbi:MAG: PIN domain-containing protein [Firmicutes bacterium]|nr:PIN domain-containing protein [Bacillota bacterium]